MTYRKKTAKKKPRVYTAESFTDAQIDKAASVLGLDPEIVELAKAARTESYDDLCASHSLPIGTVKSRLARARKQIGEFVKKQAA